MISEDGEVMAIHNMHHSIDRRSPWRLSGIYVFSRSTDTSSVVVIINNSDAQHKINIPVTWKDETVVRDHLTEESFRIQNGHISVTQLLKKSAVVLIKT